MGSIGLYKNDILVENIQFPVTRAGDKSIVKYKMINELPSHLVIEKAILSSNEITIESIPKELESFQRSELILSWSPPKDSLEPLIATIDFEVVIGR